MNSDRQELLSGPEEQLGLSHIPAQSCAESRLSLPGCPSSVPGQPRIPGLTKLRAMLAWSSVVAARPPHPILAGAGSEILGYRSHVPR